MPRTGSGKAKPAAATPARAFKQKRSEATYRALLDAASELFVERGLDAVQSVDIAARAGVSTGAFYRYFTDKRHALLEVLELRLSEKHVEISAQIAANAQGADRSDARGLIIEVLRAVVAYVRANAALTRLYLRLSLESDDVRALRRRFEMEAVEQLTTVIRALVHPPHVPDPEAAALVVHLMAFEMACERAEVRPMAGPTIDDDRALEALAMFIERALFREPGATPPVPPFNAPSAAKARKAAGAKKARKAARGAGGRPRPSEAGGRRRSSEAGGRPRPEGRGRRRRALRPRLL